MKYRSSFKLGKCEFFNEWFEYIGYDLMTHGNTTTKSKYDLIDSWDIFTTGDGLHFVVSLCNYYNKSSSCFSYDIYCCVNYTLSVQRKEYHQIVGLSSFSNPSSL